MAVTSTYILNQALDVLSEFDTSSGEMGLDTFDSQALSAFNICRREITDESEDLPYMQKVYVLTTVKDQPNYDIETLEPGLTFENIMTKRVRFQATKQPLKYTEGINMDEYVIPQQGDDFIRFYSYIGDNGRAEFGIYPVPTQDGLKIEIPYEIAITEDITPITVDADINIPYRHLNAWIFGTAYYIAAKDERRFQIAHLRERYDYAKALMVAKAHVKSMRKEIEPNKAAQRRLKQGR